MAFYHNNGGGLFFCPKMIHLAKYTVYLGAAHRHRLVNTTTIYTQRAHHSGWRCRCAAPFIKGLPFFYKRSRCAAPNLPATKTLQLYPSKLYTLPLW